MTKSCSPLRKSTLGAVVGADSARRAFLCRTRYANRVSRAFADPMKAGSAGIAGRRAPLLSSAQPHEVEGLLRSSASCLYLRGSTHISIGQQEMLCRTDYLSSR